MIYNQVVLLLKLLTNTNLEKLKYQAFQVFLGHLLNIIKSQVRFLKVVIKEMYLIEIKILF